MIPLADLKAQYRSLQHEIEPAVLQALASTEYVLGPEVRAFEMEFAAFCGSAEAVAVNSGAAALYLALRVAGVGPGDEVISVPLTFVATIAAIEATGATPILVDIDAASYLIDPVLAAKAVTSRTKALLPVHLYGQMADLDPLNALASEHGLVVIEDAAQAHGASYRGQKAGSIGTMGCFSFYPAKNLGACGEGGAVTTDDPALAQQVRMLRDWGQSTKNVHELKGGNYRMDGIQGAILRVKLRHLDEWIEARRERAARYDNRLRLADITVPSVAHYGTHTYHQYAIQSDARDQLQEQLSQEGIMTGIHYPTPVHLQPAYKNLGYPEGSFPVAEAVARRIISLPIYPELPLESVDRVAEVICHLRPRGTSS